MAEQKKNVAKDVADLILKAAEKISEIRQENLARQPTFGAEITALGRELVKDLQQTFHEVMYGKSLHAAEDGTPFNPTAQLLTEELKGVTVDEKTDMIAPAEPKREPTTLSQMRGYAEAKTKIALEQMERGHEREM